MKTLINLFQVGNKNMMCIGRDDAGKRVSELVTDFSPYFYYKHEKGDYVSLFGDKLKKFANLDSPAEVPQARAGLEHFEADIPYTRRFLVDRYTKIDKCPLRVCYLDIETATEVLNKDINYLDEVTCVTTFDSFDKKLLTFIWHPSIRKDNYYDSETAMLNSLVKYIIEKDPDIIASFNGNSFDLPYLWNRCKKLGVDFEKISMDGRMKITSFYSKVLNFTEQEFLMSGRYSFDIRRAYRYLSRGEIDSYSLHKICEKELGEGKVSIINFKKLWKENPEELIKYNRQDVKLLVKLDEKLQIVNQFNERRLEWGCDWSDLWKSTAHHDILFLRKAKELNEVLPSKQEYQKKKKLDSIEGGFVLETTAGRHENIAVFDFESMYGNIIRTFNLSPECIDDKGEIKISNGLRLANKKRGIMPLVVEEIINLRNSYKEKMRLAKESKDYELMRQYDMKQNAMKTAGNEVFGISDTQGFRLYDKRISSTITFLGQTLIKDVSSFLKGKNYYVVYMDTDSVFIKLRTDNFLEEITLLKDIINGFLSEYIKVYGVEKNFMRMNFETFMPKVYFGKSNLTDKGVKKRYAYIEKDSNGDYQVKIKGFEFVKSDSAPLTRRVQEHIFRMILLEDKNAKEVSSFVEGVKADLKSGKYSFTDFAIPKKYRRNDYVNKRNPHLDGRKWAEKNLNISFHPQSTLRMIYTKSLPRPYSPSSSIVFEFEEQFPEDLKRGLVVDWSKQFSPLITNMCEKLFDTLGFVPESKSKGLGEFL